MNELKFLKCTLCGNMMLVLKDSSVLPTCCNQPMTILKPNTNDGAVEKHVPVATKDGSNVTIQIGSTIHPMTSEHHIEFISIVQCNKVHIKYLQPNEEPIASFTVCEDEPIKVYEHCNLHGLWSN